MWRGDGLRHHRDDQVGRDLPFNPFLAIALGIGVAWPSVPSTAPGDGPALPPFIVTLGTLNIAFALTHVTSNEETIANLPDPLVYFGNTFQVGPRRSPTARYWPSLSPSVAGSCSARPSADATSMPPATIPTRPAGGRAYAARLLAVYVTAGVLYASPPWC